MNPIQVYCQKHSISYAELGRRLGTTKGAVCNWVHGWSRPTAENARKLYEASGGEIPILAVLYWEPPKRGRGKGAA